MYARVACSSLLWTEFSCDPESCVSAASVWAFPVWQCQLILYTLLLNWWPLELFCSCQNGCAYSPRKDTVHVGDPIYYCLSLSLSLGCVDFSAWAWQWYNFKNLLIPSQGLEGEDEGAISMLSDNTAKLTSAVR